MDEASKITNDVYQLKSFSLTAINFVILFKNYSTCSCYFSKIFADSNRISTVHLFGENSKVFFCIALFQHISSSIWVAFWNNTWYRKLNVQLRPFVFEIITFKAMQFSSLTVEMNDLICIKKNNFSVVKLNTFLRKWVSPSWKYSIFLMERLTEQQRSSF